MRMSLVALSFSLILSACATTQQAADKECSYVDDDATGTKITRKQECKDVPGAANLAAPQH